MQPRVGGGQHPLRRRLYGPGFRSAVIVGQETLDRRLARDVADVAAADPVRQHDSDALQAQQRLARSQRAVEILIGLFATFVRMLPDRYLQFAWHACRQKKRSLTLLEARLPGFDSNHAATRAGAALSSRFGAVLT